MKLLRSLFTIAAVAALAAGCKSHSSKQPATSAKPSNTTAVGASTNAPSASTTPQVTPGSEIRGEISRVNATARFVVLGFPVGVMPSKGTVLGIYRQSVKVAEVMVSGPQRDTFTVADILKGECRVGDAAHP